MPYRYKSTPSNSSCPHPHLYNGGLEDALEKKGAKQNPESPYRILSERLKLSQIFSVFQSTQTLKSLKSTQQNSILLKDCIFTQFQYQSLHLYCPEASESSLGEGCILG